MLRSQLKDQIRAPQKPSLRLTSRDIELFAEVYLSAVMSRDQILSLGFFQSIARCNRRCRLLAEGGLLTRYATPLSPVGGQTIYGLGKAAIPYVAAELNIDIAEVRRNCKNHVAPLFLEHTLRCADVHCAFHRAASAKGMELEYRHERLCTHAYQSRACPDEAWIDHVLKPDAFITLELSTNPHKALNAFVEVDLGHVAPQRFLEKLERYDHYRSTGMFRRTYAAEAFEILVVTITGSRAERLRTIAAESNLADRVLITLFSDLERFGSFGAIWTGCDEPTRRSLF